MKQLVLCADDFALHEAASRGIAHLARNARLSATSVMVLSPRWARDVALLQPLRGHIDVGLHLDWTSAFAVQAGHGLSIRRAMLTSLLGGFDVDSARAVIEHQLDAFESCWMAPPDHIDGHQHVQQFAGIRQALVQVLQERFGARAPYLRLSRESVPRPGLKSRIIAAMGQQGLRELAARARIPCAPHLSGIYDFAGGGARYAALMEQWLATAERDILMCHPADAVEPGDEIGAARRWEFDYLASDAFAQSLTHHQARLVRGAALYTAAR